jgi:hypothetical protein
MRRALLLTIGVLVAAAGCGDDDDDSSESASTTGSVPTDPTPPVGETEKTAVDFPKLTETFVSPRNGFSVKYHDRGEGTLTPAKALWDSGKELADDGQADDGVCRSSRSARCPADVVETGFGAVFEGASTEIPDGVSIDEWVDDVSPGACGEPRSQQEEITIDGQSSRISECPEGPGSAGEIAATVVAGGRLYRFTLLHSRTDARAVFDAFAATIDLRPEAAAVPAS